jgi:hypothetical protein
VRSTLRNFPADITLWSEPCGQTLLQSASFCGCPGVEEMSCFRMRCKLHGIAWGRPLGERLRDLYACRWCHAIYTIDIKTIQHTGRLEQICVTRFQELSDNTKMRGYVHILEYWQTSQFKPQYDTNPHELACSGTLSVTDIGLCHYLMWRGVNFEWNLCNRIGRSRPLLICRLACKIADLHWPTESQCRSAGMDAWQM